MKIVFLDEYSICNRDLSAIKSLGDYTGYETTQPQQVIERCDAQIVQCVDVIKNLEKIKQACQEELVNQALNGTTSVLA